MEFCGKKGKKNQKKVKNFVEKVRFFAPPFRKAGYGPEIVALNGILYKICHFNIMRNYQKKTKSQNFHHDN